MGALTYLFTLLPLIISVNTAMATTSSTKIYKTYIKTACNTTGYPQICYKSLSPYATTIKSNPKKLCTYAISIALKAARTTASTVSKLSKKDGLTKAEVGVVKTCLENFKDTVDELKQSLTVMKNLGGKDTQDQFDNMKTWLSATLTDEDTCTDGFDQQKVSASVKSTITKSMLNVVRLGSIALSFVDNISY